jgi:sarcosine oxidase subunit beta
MFLARHGHDVALIEKGEIASQASGVNMGGLGGIGWGNPPDLQGYLTLGSLDIFKQMQIELGFDIEFRQSGAFQAVQNEEQLGLARERVTRHRNQGFDVELLDARDAVSIEPNANPDLPGYVYMPKRGQADPVKATRAFSQAAAVSGATLWTRREVTGISVAGDGRFRLDTSQGEHLAERLVLAAGAWCGPLGAMLGIDIPIKPVRGQMWATGPLPPMVFQTISSMESSLAWSIDTGADENTPPELTHIGKKRVTRHLYGRQNAKGEVIFGGDRQLVGYDTTVQKDGIAVNKGHAGEVLPFLNRLPIARTWAGLMPFSLDGKPVIGKLARMENAYIVSGLGSSGFGRGPMAGKLLADMIHTGHPSPVLSDADPSRFDQTDA